MGVFNFLDFLVQVNLCLYLGCCTCCFFCWRTSDGFICLYLYLFFDSKDGWDSQVTCCAQKYKCIIKSKRKYIFFSTNLSDYQIVSSGGPEGEDGECLVLGHYGNHLVLPHEKRVN